MTARRSRSSPPRARRSPARATATATSPASPRSPRHWRSTSATATTSSGCGSTFPAPGASGVLFAHGSHFGGHTLYVKDNRLHYVYNFVGMLEQKIDASEDLPVGENLILSAAFVKDSEDKPGVCTGTLSLYHGEEKVGEGQIKTQPATFGLTGLRADRRAQPPRDHLRLPRRAALALHRRHDPLWRRRRQRRAVRRPRARGRRDDRPRIAATHARGGKEHLRTLWHPPATPRARLAASGGAHRRSPRSYPER